MSKKRKTLGHKALLLLAGALALVLLAAGGAFLALSRNVTANSEPLRIYLPPADNPRAAADTLRAHGLTGHAALFGPLARALKLDSRWHPGSYVVQPHTPVFRLIKRITRGQQDPLRLTIGKFRTPRQLNDYLSQKMMHNDFNVPLDSFHLVLPDTYEFYWTATPEQFMRRMAKEYSKAESTLWKGTAHAPLTSFRDAIILASIVEEETNNNAEKPVIASVYINRLRLGMPLQADPTVKYAVGDFALRRILNRHLTVDSPFNTYRHPGLPPAPICLPSKTSINAVLNAKQTAYLYFCASDRLDGTHRFAASLADHNRNAEAYHRALDRLATIKKR